MSPWEHDATKGASPFLEGPAVQRRIPAWIRVVPFFVSSFLFLSGLFSIFAPLPLLVVGLQGNAAWLILACLTNGALVYVLGGLASLALYTVFVLALAILMPLLLKRQVGIEPTVFLTLGAMVLAAVGWILAEAHLHHVTPAQEIHSGVDQLLSYLTNSLSPDARKNWMGEVDPETWKRDFIVELPSAALIASLIMVWANLVFLVRLNAGQIRERLSLDGQFFRRWKAPEILLWPTILSGAVLVFESWIPGQLAVDVALNVFKFLMAVYAIQGLSILAFVFDLWHIRGFFRSIGYLVAVLLMMPLVLSLGFFDLWFDFRGKLRQS
jgi:hypothetical protein